ncbi:627_t:CDS:2 [Rhizophagus irregularis]|nr:627_t:CDS:2 [Rhizophagus irregularis]
MLVYSVLKAVENANVKAEYGVATGEIVNLVRAEIKSRIEELEKGRTNTVAENVRRDNAISELKAEVVKLRDDNEENKQQTFFQSEMLPENTIDEIETRSLDSSNVCEKVGVSDHKSLEEKETDAFLNEHKNKEDKHVTEVSANLVCPNNETSIERNGDIVSLYKLQSLYRKTKYGFNDDPEDEIQEDDPESDQTNARV